MKRKTAKIALLSAALMLTYGAAHAQAISYGASAKFVEVATIPASNTTPGASAANVVVITKHPALAGSPRPTDGLITVVDSRGPVYNVNQTNGAVTQIMDLRTATPGLAGATSTAGNAELGVRGLAYHPDFATPGTAGYLKFYTMSCHALSSRKPTVGAIDLNHGVPAAILGTDGIRRTPDGGTSLAQTPCDNVLMEWQMNAPSVSSDTLTRNTTIARREVLRFPQLYSNHGTDALVFDPATKLLYIAAGDGGSQGDPYGAASKMDHLYGKILRINPLKPTGVVPTGMRASNDGFWSYPINNPGAGNPGRDAIYVKGFRHPETMFIYGRNLIVADIGGSRVEEINVVKLHAGSDITVAAGDEGKSFGWDGVEGRLLNTATNQIADSEAPSTIPAVSGYKTDGIQHTRPAAIIVGGVPKNNSMGAAFAGQLIFGDLVSGRVFYAPIDTLVGLRASGWQSPMHPVQEVRLFNAAGVEQTLFAKYNNNRNRVDLRLSEIDGVIYGSTKQTGKLFKLVAR